jgi:hypothetical protein
MSARLRVIGRRTISEFDDRLDQQGAVEQGAVVVVGALDLDAARRAARGGGHGTALLGRHDGVV